MVFGIADISAKDYIEHIRARLIGQSKIDFVCRYATLGDDSESDDFYVFLTPDEGLSDICRLHDSLYAGLLKKFHRIEIPYIPHIGIATLQDAGKIQALCDGLNTQNLCISGTLEGATVCQYDGIQVVNIENIEFEV